MKLFSHVAYFQGQIRFPISIGPYCLELEFVELEFKLELELDKLKFQRYAI